MLLRDVLAKQALTGGDIFEVDALNAKINLVSMKEIVSDAWKWWGLTVCLPSRHPYE